MLISYYIHLSLSQYTTRGVEYMFPVVYDSNIPPPLSPWQPNPSNRPFVFNAKLIGGEKEAQIYWINLRVYKQNSDFLRIQCK